MAPLDVLPPPQTITTDPTATAQTARVSFRQPVSSAGFIDGGWWPHSRDLTVELPALLDVFWTACREIVHVSYNLDFWDAAPRRFEVEGRRVRLAGFHGQNPLTVFLSDARHSDTAEILLIQPDTDPATAQRALELASATGGTDRAAKMLERATSGGASS